MRKISYWDWTLRLAFGLGCVAIAPPLSAQAGEILRASESSCLTIGRVVLSWDSGIKNGSWVCEKDVLRVGQNLRVDLLCLNQRSVIQLQGGSHRAGISCTAVSQSPPRRCFPNTRLSCSRLRGNEKEVTPRLQTPYGDLLTQAPERLSWKAVENASRYRVYIEGEGDFWEFEVEKTQLSQLEMMWKPEGTYLVTVVALSEQDFLSQSNHVFNMMELNQWRSLQQEIQHIQAQANTPVEAMHQIQQVYWQAGLTHLTIEYLESIQRMGNEESETLILLGDRYLDLGRFDLARQAYQQLLESSSLEMKTVAKTALKRLEVMENMPRQPSINSLSP